MRRGLATRPAGSLSSVMFRWQGHPILRSPLGVPAGATGTPLLRSKSGAFLGCRRFLATTAVRCRPAEQHPQQAIDFPPNLRLEDTAAVQPRAPLPCLDGEVKTVGVVDLLNPGSDSEKEPVTLDNHMFGAPIRRDIVHRVVRWQLAKRRKGNAFVKTRAEVSGGGRKPWPQKGTGRARHGSIRSPLWRGGGKAHGPRNPDFSFKLPKKVGGLPPAAMAFFTAVGDLMMVYERVPASCNQR